MTLTLTLRTPQPGRVHAAGLVPERLRELDASEVVVLPVRCGAGLTAVGDLFDVSGAGDEVLVFAGDLRRVDGIGAEMAGGVVRILGDAGARLGSAYPGVRAGMSGGEIVVSGDAGEEAGACMRRGLVAVGGQAGSGAGLRMLAGTVIALGGIGAEAGIGNKRGSLVSGAAVDPLPGYAFATRYRPPALGLQLRRVRELGLTVGNAHLRGTWARWSGDHTEVGRGEILIVDEEEAR